MSSILAGYAVEVEPGDELIVLAAVVLVRLSILADNGAFPFSDGAGMHSFDPFMLRCLLSFVKPRCYETVPGIPEPLLTRCVFFMHGVLCIGLLSERTGSVHGGLPVRYYCELRVCVKETSYCIARKVLPRIP